MGYIAWKAAPVLEGKLKQETMWNLFLNMEMPLIYSLYHMEQAGIRVEKETLKAYGDKLKIKITQFCLLYTSSAFYGSFQGNL